MIFTIIIYIYIGSIYNLIYQFGIAYNNCTPTVWICVKVQDQTIIPGEFLSGHGALLTRAARAIIRPWNLDDNPQWHHHIIFVKVATPARSKILFFLKAYKSQPQTHPQSRIHVKNSDDLYVAIILRGYLV